jgi:hypothetical protein
MSVYLIYFMHYSGQHYITLTDGYLSLATYYLASIHLQFASVTRHDTSTSSFQLTIIQSIYSTPFVLSIA